MTAACLAYVSGMTKLLERAVEAVRKLSAAEQDEIAHAMLLLAEQDKPEPIAPEHLAAVLKGLEKAERREFAGDSEVESAFRHFGR